MLGALYCIPLGYRKCAVLISYHAKTERFGCVLASIDDFGSNHLFHKRLQNGILFLIWSFFMHLLTGILL